MYLCTMTSAEITHIVTDIEGTTTSVDFVYQTLFPYFREHLNELMEMNELEEIQQIFEETRTHYFSMEKKHLTSNQELIDVLRDWSLKDLKITPLKTLQGIIWRKGYLEGKIKGHIFPDVPEHLIKWHGHNIQLSIFSSGSVAAQQLLFRYSTYGDLTPYIQHYFDTQTGTKREGSTYQRIAEKLQVNPINILFLSDIPEELEAAKNAGMQTIQLVREKTLPAWPHTATNFKEITI
jgi:enolase-phosphatase E1